MLSQGVLNTSTIYEERGQPITKHKGFLSMRFSEHNLTVEYYRVPFLVVVGRPPLDSSTDVKMTVKVDQLHWFSEKWVGADVLVFGGGHWWNEDKTLKMYELLILLPSIVIVRLAEYMHADAGKTYHIYIYIYCWNVCRGCYFENGGKVNTSMHALEAFGRSLETWKSWAIQNLDPQRSHIFFRSFSPVHYRQVFSTSASLNDMH